MKNIAVILAGGSGNRFGSNVPKQFLTLAGRTVLEHSVLAFENCPSIDEIYIVMNADFIETASSIVKNNKWKKVTKILRGGNERFSSAMAAVIACKETEANLIFHDAARPAIEISTIKLVTEALKNHEAVAVSVPATDTVFETDNDGKIIRNILNRKILRCAQTPQAFRFELIKKACEKAAADPHFESTDDCGTVLRYFPETEIFLVEGEPSNIKLTFPDDKIFLENVLKNRNF